MQVRDSNNIQKGTQAVLEGVVDVNGKFLDQEFIYACDLSIFPTSPAANPSLTAVALALRLSDHLVRLVNP
jgi:choline dehydrogenase-like flavoprotein